MDDINVIEVSDVSMCFNLYKEKVDNIKEYAIKFLQGKLHYEPFWALQDINFSVKKGEALGLIGLNGSGKSTLLKILSSVLKPTKGKIIVRGSVAPLIELGAGFDLELTARENIFLNGAVLGYSKKEIADNFSEIVAFSELEEFLDVPIKNYSSGMYARLGFSIATISRPDILIVDEILAVGDIKFQEKCIDKINELLANNATIIFVSHSLEQICSFCDRVLWLDHGRIVKYGDTETICEMYKNF